MATAMRAMSILLFVFALANVNSTRGETAVQRMVLLVDENSSLEALTAKQLRRTYMGVPLIVNDLALTPLLYVANEKLTAHFMQKIMFMTESAYERMTFNHNFRNGRPAPTRFHSLSEFKDYAKRHKNWIIVLPYVVAKSIQGGKIVDF